MLKQIYLFYYWIVCHGKENNFTQNKIKRIYLLCFFLVYMYKQKERERSGSLNFGSGKKYPAVVLQSKRKSQGTGKRNVSMKTNRKRDIRLGEKKSQVSLFGITDSIG